MRCLVEKGAVLDCKDKDETSPLHLISAEGNMQVSVLLLLLLLKPAQGGGLCVCVVVELEKC